MQSGAGMIQQDRDSNSGAVKDYNQNTLITHASGGASGGRLGRGAEQLQ